MRAPWWAPVCVAAAVTFLPLNACRTPRPLPPPLPPPTVALSAENLPASTRIELDIENLVEVASDDKVEVIVSGSVVNRGTRATDTVLIQVSGIDREGRTIQSVQVTPSRQRIEPNGGRAAFSAVLPNDKAVDDYRVDAFGYAIGVTPGP